MTMHQAIVPFQCCFLLLLVSVPLGSRAVAQIIPDGTLGPESSEVVPNGVTVAQAEADLIRGGALRQENLFHSFEQFSIGEGQRVYFDNPAGVERVFSRVTGNLPSDIWGTLGSLGDADVFFLNPNGVVFGPNARLDIGGSFVVSTTDSLAFADGSEFSAAAPETSLLTISVPLGLRLDTPLQGNINSVGQLEAGQDLTLQGRELYLEGGLAAGDDLTLLAQDTVTIRDTAAVPFGAQSGGNLTIQGHQGIDIWTLQHLEQTPFVSGGDLTLISDGAISGDAHFASGGGLQFLTLAGEPGNFVSFYDPIISANGDVVFGDYTGVALKVEATGSIAAGDIVITGPDLTLVADGSGSDEDLLASSRAAILRAGVALENAANVPQTVGGTTFANGVLAEQPPGSIVVSSINTSDTTGGPGGPIILEADGNIVATGSFEGPFPNQPVSLGSFSDIEGDDSSNGGTISLAAAGDIFIEGSLSSSSSTFWFDVADSITSQDGGAITVSAGGGIVIEGGLVSATSAAWVARADSSASGDGGTITVSANKDIVIEGGLDSRSTAFASLELTETGDGGAILVESTGGAVTIESGLDSSSGSTADFGPSESGDGGAISIKAAGDVAIEGGLDSFSRSGSLSIRDSNSVASGNGGAILVESTGGEVTIEGGLDSSSSSEEPFPESLSQSIVSGDGGAIAIAAAGDVDIEGRLDSGTFVGSDLQSSEGGNGGNVTLLSSFGDIQIANPPDDDASSDSPFLISSFSFSGAGNTGNGGIVSLRAPTGSILGDGQITTIAITEIAGTTGAGGDVSLATASTISGLEILTLASSDNSGNVNIQGNGNPLTVENLSLTTSGQVEVSPFGSNRTITLNLDDLGQSGNTSIRNSGDIVLHNVNIEASANGSQPAGGVTITSPSQVTFTNSQISSNANSTGGAGTIEINAARLSLGEGDLISAATSESSTGRGGSVTINATDTVELGEGSACYLGRG